jgi:DNA invertase Pin-like site-specific DNA recombinase
MKKQVFAYLRTSNKNGTIALDGDSKDRQLTQIRRFVRGKGWRITRTFYDLSVSGDNGADLGEREQFSDMMLELKANGIKAFVVADQQRFSRSILTAEIIKQDCRENGISAFDASTGNDLAISKNENPEVELINNLLQAISAYDKLKTVQRLQGGRRRAKKQGRRIGGNYGYGAKAGETDLLERIGELRNPAGKRRLSFQAIANTLANEGYATRKGTPFSRQQIHRIAGGKKKKD